MDFDLLTMDAYRGPLIEVQSVFPIAVVGVLCPGVLERQAALLSVGLIDAARVAGWVLAVWCERVWCATSSTKTSPGCCTRWSASPRPDPSSHCDGEHNAQCSTVDPPKIDLFSTGAGWNQALWRSPT